jgi:hypothetical protein
MKTRREFITTAALALPATQLRAFGHLPKITTPLQSSAPTAGVNLAVSTKRTRTVPKNFVGLSYESEQLAGPHFFSSSNGQLVSQFKALAPNGILRLGGNTSETSWWQATPAATQPEHATYPITPAAIDNLAKFLKDTGWSCIYGLNLGNGSAALDTAEAVYVATALGKHLEYFQIGNTVDLYPQSYRDPATWGPDAYFAEWLALARAITAKVPNAKFGGPDVASHSEWFNSFAASLAKVDNPPHVVALSHHHYAGGPPSSSKMSVPFLLSGKDNDVEIAGAAALGLDAAKQLHAGLRVAQANTCTGGGKPGVSDTLAASLWAADYLLHLASLGYAGVNIHGGDARAIADSIGTSLPGNDLHPKEDEPRPFYTPIADVKGIYTAEPIFYGMMLAQQFAEATFLDVTFDPTFLVANSTETARVNATAYAAIRPDGKTILAIINKDLVNDIVLHVAGAYPASTLRLAASAPSAADVTFAHATVTANGQWNPHPESSVIFYGHNAPLRIPSASAVYIVCH